MRDKDGFKEMLKMHNYTYKMMSNKDKILTTYTKFKMIYYCNTGYHAKAKELK